MDYNNLTTENFNEYLEKFKKFEHGINFYLYLVSVVKNNEEFKMHINEKKHAPIINELFDKRSRMIDIEDFETEIYNKYNQQFILLFNFSKENNLHYDLCSFKVYLETFEKRFLDYKNIFVDTELIEFAKLELTEILKSPQNLKIFYTAETKKIISDAKNKKGEYLINILKNNNYRVDVTKRIEYEFEILHNVHIGNLKKNKINLEPETIDLSDTTATQKIIYLQKLGVIDFLRNKQPFLSSTHSLATVLSAVTGEKTGTIQPMLNPMINKEAGQKNNPFRSKITVSKVEKQLINIGFNLNETI
jgi:hypothetical protein